jgi:hypothetical protein
LKLLFTRNTELNKRHDGRVAAAAAAKEAEGEMHILLDEIDDHAVPDTPGSMRRSGSIQKLHAVSSTNALLPSHIATSTTPTKAAASFHYGSTSLSSSGSNHGTPVASPTSSHLPAPVHTSTVPAVTPLASSSTSPTASSISNPPHHTVLSPHPPATTPPSAVSTAASTPQNTFSTTANTTMNSTNLSTSSPTSVYVRSNTTIAATHSSLKINTTTPPSVFPPVAPSPTAIVESDVIITDISNAPIDVDIRNAAIFGEATKIEILLSQGANINSVDEDGWSALHHAAYYGHLDVVQELLKFHVNITKRTKVKNICIFTFLMLFLIFFWCE